MKHFFLILILTGTLLSCATVYQDSHHDIYPYRVNIAKDHEMMILNSGIASLKQRLDMIARAERSIELEYYIFNYDRAGRLVLQALVKKMEEKKKAGEEFSVRILVDKGIAVFELDRYFANALKKYGIELRYYNPSSVFTISAMQYRNHRKVIIIDGVEAITGGRNIADEYFDLSEDFNFLDRDVWVKGEIVSVIRETFNRYWNSKIVEVPRNVKPPFLRTLFKSRRKLKEYQGKLALTEETLVQNEEDREVLRLVNSLGREILQQKSPSVCSQVGFASDKEGAKFRHRWNSKRYHRKYRHLRQEIAERLEHVENRVTIDSPYFILNERSLKTLKRLLDEKKSVTILTNSLGSTDAILIATVFNSEITEWVVEDKFNAYVYSGQWSGETPHIPDYAEKAVWGTHSKTFVIDDDKIIVGTYNVNNRSSFYNTEMALFCDGNKALADEVMANIHKRMEKSYHLNEKGVPANGESLLQDNSVLKKFLYYFLKIPGYIFKHLL